MSRRIDPFVAGVLAVCMAEGCKTESPEGSQNVATGAGSQAGHASAPASPEAAREVVRQLAAGEHGTLRRRFDGAMQRAFPDDAALAKWWRDVIRQTGAFREHFAAKMASQGKHTNVVLTCFFAQAPQDVLVMFDQRGQIAGFKVSPSTNPDVRPQTPRPPFPYASKEVSYANTESHTTIAGTLTVPAGAGPHPAVLLISGSGSQDRNGTLAGHPLFLVIADHLSRQGFAVLRVDDRGVGGSTGDPLTETLELIATDVEAGLSFLAKQPGIDPKRVGLVGHSMGGTVAPMVAARSAAVAFVVSLAGPAASGVELIPAQVRTLLTSEGRPADVIDEIVAAHEQLTPLIAKDAGADALEPAIAALVKAAQRLVPEGAPPRATQAVAEQLRQQVTGPWHRSFAKSEPARHLTWLRQPALLLFADKDVTIPAKLNVDRAEQALATAGNAKARVEVMAGLNHLFQSAKTGAADEYVMITQTIDPRALVKLTGWLRAAAGLTTE